MTKKPAKTAPAASAKTPAATKTSKLKMMLLACAPLVLAGGGYAGWTLYTGGFATAKEGGPDAASVAAISPEIAAENSFTYSFALSELLRRDCGPVRTPALVAATDAEARADGALVNLSWIAANRRVGTLTERSCRRMLIEIYEADAKAAALAAEAGKAKAAH